MILTQDEENRRRELGRIKDVPCQRCGKLIIHDAFAGKYPKYCKTCSKIVREEQRMATGKNKYEIRYEKAIEEIAKQVPVEDYIRAISIAKKRMYDYGSIPEAMVAIELVKYGCRVIPQQQVLNYHVDFLLPDEKIVIEVDGDLYHQKETDREAKIQLALGVEWEIIHLPAEAIRKNIKAVDKCIEVRRMRKKQ